MNKCNKFNADTYSIESSQDATVHDLPTTAVNTIGIKYLKIFHAGVVVSQHAYKNDGNPLANAGITAGTVVKQRFNGKKNLPETKKPCNLSNIFRKNHI